MISSYGLGEKKERGERLADWGMEKNLAVMNAWFSHHKRHLWTWKSPGDITRNQIDYILINKRFRNAVTQVRTYPGAAVDSDHLPLIASMTLKLKKVKKPRNLVRYDTHLLGRSTDLTQTYAIKVRNRYENLELNDNDSAEAQWDILSEILNEMH